MQLSHWQVPVFLLKTPLSRETPAAKTVRVQQSLPHEQEMLCSVHRVQVSASVLAPAVSQARSSSCLA